ncbi:MAG: acyl-CoA dehydrogenase [Acidimicrobiales bacterium]
MAEYSPPLDDIRFVLGHLVGLEALSKLEPYGHADPETVYGVLEEFGRLMHDVWSPTNLAGDVEGSRLDADGVHTPSGFVDAYRQYVAAGWPAVPFSFDYDGGGFPRLVGIVMQEMLNSANMALAMAPLLTQGALDAILLHGTEEQREVYAKRMVSGEWTGTMNLTEPEAGSDVGALRTKAVRRDDGSYGISGQKIFITFGDHDMADNIIHLVLARTPGAPPGTKGISCFIVPKFLVDDDGSLGKRNDVHVVSIEHKMGIKASPTCVLAYGDDSDGAVGYLIGEEHAGMRYMFTMMNNARLGVGTEGLGLAERAYQRAVEHALERTQGHAPGAAPGTTSALVEHPDVRRMLLTMRAYVEAMRAMCYVQAEQIDLAAHHPDEAGRTEARELVDLLTPLVKSWCTDLAETVTSLAIQVHGGVGYIEETGVAQYYRDAKITQIYEGTNGIQAMDLVGRKVPMRSGGVVADQMARMRATHEELGEPPDPRLAPIHRELGDAIAVLEQATAWLVEHGATDPLEALSAASPYQRIFATTVGGWLMARSALVARRQLEDGTGETAFLEAKVVTARFFAQHLLPQVRGLLSAVTAGKDDILALTPAQLTR